MAYFSMMLLLMNPPLQQWQAPIHMQLSESAKGGGERAAITSTPLNLVAMQPCRLLDTRPSAPANQRLISGPIAANVAVEVPVRNGTCALPATALGYSFNVTVDTTATGPLAFLSAWPTGSRPASLVSILNAPNGGFVANAVTIAAGTGGSIDLFASSATHVVIDVNGYYVPGNQGPVAVYRTPAPAITTPFCATVVSNVVHDYSIKEIDTDNAVTTGANDWRFVAPVGGHYHVAATLDLTQSATTYDLYKVTPSLVAAPPVRTLTVTGRPTTISTVMYLGAGEAIRTMSNATTSCGGLGWISIHYVRP